MPPIHYHRPQEAFDTFPKASAPGFPVAHLSDRFLEAGVALLPGTALRQYGEAYLRLAFTSSTNNIEGTRAIQSFN